MAFQWMQWQSQEAWADGLRPSCDLKFQCWMPDLRTYLIDWWYIYIYILFISIYICITFIVTYIYIYFLSLHLSYTCLTKILYDMYDIIICILVYFENFMVSSHGHPTHQFFVRGPVPVWSARSTPARPVQSKHSNHSNPYDTHRLRGYIKIAKRHEMTDQLTMWVKCQAPNVHKWQGIRRQWSWFHISRCFFFSFKYSWWNPVMCTGWNNRCSKASAVWPVCVACVENN